VNDAPVLDSLGVQLTDEEIPLTIMLSASDVDEDDLTFSAVSEYPVYVSAEVTGNQLTLTPGEDFNGSVNISVTVSDNISNEIGEELTDSEVFELTVIPVNDAPIIEDIADTSMAEDTQLSIALSASDVDDGTGPGDENDLSFSAESDTPAISVSVSGDELTITPDADYFGSGTITVTVTDMGSRLTDETSFGVTINNVNDAPVLTDIDEQTTEEDSVLIVPIYASDIDSYISEVTAVSDSPEDVSVEVELIEPVTDIDGNVYETVYIGEQLCLRRRI
jgi:hypothetical protein